jgi:hypothetical protein
LIDSFYKRLKLFCILVHNSPKHLHKLPPFPLAHP